jgi:uncharacterized protein
MPDFFNGPVVCNTGPILGLFRVGQVGLLPRLFPKVMVPREVVTELLAAPYADALELEHELAAFETVDLKGGPEPLLVAELDAGEAAVIAAARVFQVSGIIMDERKGRRIASLIYGLQVKGTCGLLVAAKQRGLISAVRPLIEGMKAKGYYLGPRLVAECLRQSGE